MLRNNTLRKNLHYTIDPDATLPFVTRHALKCLQDISGNAAEIEIKAEDIKPEALSVCEPDSNCEKNCKKAGMLFLIIYSVCGSLLIGRAVYDKTKSASMALFGAVGGAIFFAYMPQLMDTYREICKEANSPDPRYNRILKIKPDRYIALDNNFEALKQADQITVEAAAKFLKDPTGKEIDYKKLTIALLITHLEKQLIACTKYESNSLSRFFQAPSMQLDQKEDVVEGLMKREI